MRSPETIDLRSDTVTRPTPEMRAAMAAAEVGDDVYGEDPTVEALQREAASRLGFEAALFVPSGTMGNAIGIRLLTSSGDEILVDDRSHVVQYELAGMALFAGVIPRALPTADGLLRPDAIRGAVRPRAYYRSDLTAVVLENTHNLAGGSVYDVEAMRAAMAAAREAGLRVHVDGARVWNAAVALGVEPRELLEGADTAMVCLSKGLCAPVGSLLLASAARVEEARRHRKRMGGGMRQVGVLAAAGLVALRTMVGRLREDHENAALLGEALGRCPGVRVAAVRTNIVVAAVEGRSVLGLAGRAAEDGLRVSAMDDRTLRLVTHHDVTRQQCETAAEVLAALLGGRA